MVSNYHKYQIVYSLTAAKIYLQLKFSNRSEICWPLFCSKKFEQSEIINHRCFGMWCRNSDLFMILENFRYAGILGIPAQPRELELHSLGDSIKFSAAYAPVLAHFTVIQNGAMRQSFSKGISSICPVCFVTRKCCEILKLSRARLFNANSISIVQGYRAIKMWRVIVHIVGLFGAVCFDSASPYEKQ